MYREGKYLSPSSMVSMIHPIQARKEKKYVTE
jgi:hypothetical protein